MPGGEVWAVLLAGHSASGKGFVSWRVLGGRPGGNILARAPPFGGMDRSGCGGEQLPAWDGTAVHLYGGTHVSICVCMCVRAWVNEGGVGRLGQPRVEGIEQLFLFQHLPCCMLFLALLCLTVHASGPGAPIMPKACGPEGNPSENLHSGGSGSVLTSLGSRPFSCKSCPSLPYFQAPA
jgi:hypothetical protein